MGIGAVVETILNDSLAKDQSALATRVTDALREVMDPHMGVSLLDMGMVTEVRVDETGRASIGLVFPCIGCPAFEVIQHDAKQAARRVPGITDAIIRLDWAATWSKTKMSEAARDRAKVHGYVI